MNLRYVCPSLIVAAVLVFPVAAQEPGGDLFWGVNGHPLVSYPGVTFEQQLDYVKDLGMTSYRVDISHVDHLVGLAKLLRAAKSRGISILPVITPPLNRDADSPDQLYAKAYQLAIALVSPFKEDIRVWELGNEMESYAIIKPCEMQDDGVQYNCAWGPAGGVGPLEYYGPRWAKVSAVLKGLSDGVTKVDPSIRKAMGTAGWGHVGAFARMKQDGIQWDISVWHMYGEDPEWGFKFLADFGRPIWVTEFNSPRGGEKSEEEQARGLIAAVTRLRQLRRTYNVEAAYVYELMDETYWAPSFEAVMGLVRLERQGEGRWKPGLPKRAYHVTKEMILNRYAGNGECDLNPSNRLNSYGAMQLSYSYCLLLDRAIDGQGFRDWMAALNGGAKITDVLLAIMESDEFDRKFSRSQLGHSEYVHLLYRLLLKREPDGGGLSSYASQIEQGMLSRRQVAEAVMMSSEFRAKHPILVRTD